MAPTTLISATTAAVHHPAPGQYYTGVVDAQKVLCAPTGRRTSNGHARYFWTTAPVTCKRCLTANAKHHNQNTKEAA